MSETASCHYHPTKKAAKRCEHCKKLTCLADIRKHEKYLEESVIIVELCVPCYYKEVTRENTGWHRFFPLILSILFTMLFIVVWAFFNSILNDQPNQMMLDDFFQKVMLLAFVIAALILFFFNAAAFHHVFIKGPKKWKEAYIDHEEFLATIEEN